MDQAASKHAREQEANCVDVDDTIEDEVRVASLGRE